MTVGSAADRAIASKAVPAELAPDLIVSVGDLPRDLQSGYAAGDYTYGGWPLYTAPNDPRCTSGFVVKMSDASYGVTTAGHCSTVNPSIWVNNHYVTLNPAVVWTNTGYYDFKVHPSGQLTTYGYVWYVNNQPIRGYESIVNSVAGYPNSGYFGIEDGLYKVAHVVGSTMCKSGQRTGLSCGQIVSTNATYTTEDGVSRSGMIALGNSSQRVLGYSGDSGGPVFTPPTAGGTVPPAGSVSSANGPASGGPCDTTVYTGCQLYYMPIDRINDAQPMQVVTMNGTVNP